MTNYYKNIKSLPTRSDQDIAALLAEESKVSSTFQSQKLKITFLMLYICFRSTSQSSTSMLHCLSFTTTLKPIVFRLVLLFMILLSRLLNAFWTTFFVFFQISKSLRDDEAAVNFHLPSKLENVHQLMSVRNEEDATYVVDPRYENFRAWRHHLFSDWFSSAAAIAGEAAPSVMLLCRVCISLFRSGKVTLHWNHISLNPPLQFVCSIFIGIIRF